MKLKNVSNPEIFKHQNWLVQRDSFDFRLILITHVLKKNTFLIKSVTLSRLGSSRSASPLNSLLLTNRNYLQLLQIQFWIVKFLLLKSTIYNIHYSLYSNRSLCNICCENNLAKTLWGFAKN